jgi:hypothetical protein
MYANFQLNPSEGDFLYIKVDVLWMIPAKIRRKSEILVPGLNPDEKWPESRD